MTKFTIDKNYEQNDMDMKGLIVYVIDIYESSLANYKIHFEIEGNLSDKNGIFGAMGMQRKNTLNTPIDGNEDITLPYN